MCIIYGAHPCDACSYQAPERLDYYGSNLGTFYGIATCQGCKHLISSLCDADHIPSRFIERFGSREDYITRIKNVCPLCKSHDLWNAFQNNSQFLSTQCPRCATGHVQLRKIGYWG